MTGIIKYYKLFIKNIFLYGVFLIFPTIANGQNLVPNPGFENSIDCPKNKSGISQNLLSGSWASPTEGTPDYFNSCSKYAGVPKNFMGYLHAHSGNAYAGIVNMVDFTNEKKNNTREYLQVKLKTKLTKNQNYKIEMYYALATNSRFSTDLIGIYLSDREIDSVDFIGNLSFVPQVESIKNRFILSTDNWTKLTGQFKSSGNEEYLIIGNFRNNNQTSWKENPGGTFQYSYFYIDDVSIYNVFDDLDSDLKFLQKENNIPIKPKMHLVFNPEEDYYTYNWYIFNNVTFDFNEYEIKEKSYTELNRIVKTLVINPSVNILISGHTDSVGTHAYNKKLSELRAMEIANYLTKNGIPKSRIKSVGYGSKKPIITGKDTSLNKRNRRVEFMFFE